MQSDWSLGHGSVHLHALVVVQDSLSAILLDGLPLPVPVPLVDLAPGQAESLAQLSNLSARPVGIHLELLLKHLGLLVGEPLPALLGLRAKIIGIKICYFSFFSKSTVI